MRSFIGRDAGRKPLYGVIIVSDLFKLPNSLVSMYIVTIALVALAVAHVAQAQTLCAPEGITARLPGVDPNTVKTSPIDGLCEIAIGPQIVYVTPDAQYLMRGDIIDIETNINLTDARRASARARVLDSLSTEDMIVFSPEKVEHTITAFVDIDCGYCRKMHREIHDLNSKDIRVQYLFFPRSGPGSASWLKAQGVRCSADRNDALTRAMNGENVQSQGENCEDLAVNNHYAMGQMVGLRGTPAIVTESGELISGYLPAAAMLNRLESLKAPAHTPVE